MKRLILLLTMACFSALSLLASRDTIPTDAVLANYYKTGQLCVCVYFEEEVCNDVVFVGTYNGWSDTPSQCTKFEPVEGFSGWYVVAITDLSEDIQGKPVQLKGDGTFSWDYQTGDKASWTTIRGTVTISDSFSGESNLKGYSKATPVVLISKYFKNHNTPCSKEYVCPTPTEAVSEDWYFSHMYDARCTELINTWSKDNNEYIYRNADNENVKITADGEWLNFYWADPSSIVFDNIYVSKDGYYDMEWYFRCDNIDGDTLNGSASQIWVNGELLESHTVWKTNEGIELDTTTIEGVELYANFPNKIKITKGNGWPLTRGIKLIGEKSPSPPEPDTIPNDEIWYTSSNGQVIQPYHTDDFGVHIVSNTYIEGKGIIKFDGNVMSVGCWAFYECTGLTSVTIPNSVMSIGGLAFFDCTGLTSITIPNSVTSIGDCAFYNCTSLTSINIPNSVTSIERSAFGYCNNLTSVHITDLANWCAIKFSEHTSNPLYYAKHLFVNDNEVTELNIPQGVTSIGDYAFRNCTSVTSVTIPNSVMSIGGLAFFDCTGLTSITIPNSVTNIGSGAFTDCPNLTSIIIESGNTKYDSRDNSNSIIESASNTLLLGCKSSIIPNSVTSIGSSAFSGCTGLTSITIPNSVTSIEDWAFYRCTGLTSITLPNGITSMEAYAFSNCTSLTSVIIPESVKSIGSSAFSGCTGLTSVTIPNSVTSIWSGAFDYCNNLTSVHITDLANWCAIKFNNETSNPLYYAKHLFINNKEVTELNIPQGMTSIGDYAFQNCTSVTSVTIPNSITNIGKCAFSGCTNLPVENNLRYADTYLVEAVDKSQSSYTVKAGTKWIGDKAFQSCSNLTSVTIPNTVTTIGDGGFSGCSRLAKMFVKAIVPPTCLGNCFVDMDRNMSLYVPAISIDAYKSAYLWRVFSNVYALPDIESDTVFISYALNGGVTNPKGWIRSTDMFWTFIQDCNIGLDSTAMQPGQFLIQTYEDYGSTTKQNAIWATLNSSTWTWLNNYLVDEIGATYGDSTAQQTINRMKETPSIMRGAIDNFFNNGKLNYGNPWCQSFDGTDKGVVAYNRYANYWKAGWAGDSAFVYSQDFHTAKPYYEGKSFYGWYKEPTFKTLLSDSEIIDLALSQEGKATIYARYDEYIPSIEDLWNMPSSLSNINTMATGIVTYVDDSTFYIQDKYAGIVCTGEHTQISIGDSIRLGANLVFESAIPKLINANSIEKISKSTIKAPSIQLSSLKLTSDGYMYQYVYFDGLLLTAAEDGKLTFSSNENTIQFVQDDIDAKNYTIGKQYHVYAIVTQYNGIIRLTGNPTWISIISPDSNTYDIRSVQNEYNETTDLIDYTITSNWLISRNQGNWDQYKPNPVAEQSRGMCVANGKVYVNWRSSNENPAGKLNVYNATTGEKLDDVYFKDYVFQQPAKDTTGARVYTDSVTGFTYLNEGFEWNYDEFSTGLIWSSCCDMQVDAAGHVLVASQPTQGHVMQIWKINPETGDGEIVLYLGGNSGISDLAERFPLRGDIWLARFAVYGDVTKDATIIYSEQNSSNVYEFNIKNGKWDGEVIEITCLNGVTPTEESIPFGYCPRPAFTEGGKTFYVDGFSTYPELFDLDGNMLESFNGVFDEAGNQINPSCTDLLYDDSFGYQSPTGVCGCQEFKVGGATFFAMAGGSYEGSYKPNGSTKIFRYKGAKCHFHEMIPMWEVSKNGFGDTKNAQFNYKQQAIVVDSVTTELYIFVAENGLGKYTIKASKYLDTRNLIVSSDNRNQGTTYGSGHYLKGDTVHISAQSNNGYRFVRWNDGNTENPRVVTVVSDTTFTAEFAVNHYQVTFVNYDGTQLQSDSLPYGSIPNYTQAIPSKPATAKYSYTFKGWNPNITTITGNTIYTAQYDSIVNKYTITFKNEDGTVLQSTDVEYGVKPVYSGELPTKQATVQYTYTFDSWSPALADVTGNATYTATYTSTINKYEIAFVNYDGTTLQSSQVDYGVIPTYEGATPTKQATAKYTYTFKGWNPTIVSVTGNATYTAVFDSVVNKYTITFKNEDGTILQSSDVEYDQLPKYNGVTPTKPSTAQYTYTFAGWSPAISLVKGEATYTATFTTATEKYLVSFLNYDGTVLQSDSILFGSIPNYSGAIPTKAKTDKYTYSFKGWNPSIASVTGNAIYTAVFDSVVNKYMIVFKNEDGTVLQSSEVEYDQLPTYNGATPTKQATAQYTYTFTGWSPAISLVKGDATYTATYTTATEKYLVSFLNYDGTVLQSDSILFASIPSYNGPTPTKSKTAKYTYTFKGWNPTIVSVTANATYKAVFDSVVNKYMITFKNEDGTVLQSSEVEYDQMPAYTGATPTKQATAQYIYTFAGWNPEVVLVIGEATYTATYSGTINQYTISVSGENGVVTGAGTYDYGTQVTLTATPNEHYHFVRWSDGETSATRIVTVTADATYTAEFALDQFTLTVKSANEQMGSVTGSGTYDYNSNAILSATAEYGYTFSKWTDGNTDNPRTVTITKDAQYVAMFVAKQFTITVVSADESMGTVTGSGEYTYNTNATLTTTPADGYEFDQWDDGNTDTPRTLLVTEDKILIASFKVKTAIEDVYQSTSKTKKLFIDGHLYILRDGKTYTTQGAMVNER